LKTSKNFDPFLPADFPEKWDGFCLVFLVSSPYRSLAEPYPESCQGLPLMPASIVTSLVLFWASLLPGVSLAASPSPVRESTQAQLVSADHSSLISLVSSVFVPSEGWMISEADTEEEDPSDGEGLIPSDQWTSLHSGRPGQGSTIRLDRVLVPTAFRSPILRC
jgi:hypothetical protein